MLFVHCSPLIDQVKNPFYANDIWMFIKKPPKVSIVTEVFLISDGILRFILHVWWIVNLWYTLLLIITPDFFYQNLLIKTIFDKGSWLTASVELEYFSPGSSISIMRFSLNSPGNIFLNTGDVSIKTPFHT